MSPQPTVDEILAAIQSGARYRHIDPGLVRRLIERELANRRNAKEVVKAVRSCLHQVGAVYIGDDLNLEHLRDQLESLPGGDPAALQSFCRSALAAHASTRERLPILGAMYATIFADLGPIHSLADYACGLNPLTYPWLNLAPQATIWAGDIFSDLADFLNQFFKKANLNGTAVVHDLAASIPSQPVQVGLLLKALPCLEHLDKRLPMHLLEELPCETLLVTYPARSLGGRSKGMVQNYAERFNQLTAGKPWRIHRYDFSSELAFVIQK